MTKRVLCIINIMLIISILYGCQNKNQVDKSSKAYGQVSENTKKSSGEQTTDTFKTNQEEQNDQSKNYYKEVFLTGDKDSIGNDLRPYTSGKEKVDEYDWYSGVMTEFNYSRTDGVLFKIIESYHNPIDLAYMEYLNGRGNTSEAARRGYQISYAAAWIDEFYHVAGLIYESLSNKEEKELLVDYIKTTNKMIDLKNKEMIIDIYVSNSTTEERSDSMYYGNGTAAWQFEEAAQIYRTEALNMIRQYNDYLTNSSDDNNKQYEYKTTKIEFREGINSDIPEYFK